jgi:hypothetical protein
MERYNFLIASVAIEGESFISFKKAILFGEIAEGVLFQREKEII